MSQSVRQPHRKCPQRGKAHILLLGSETQGQRIDKFLFLTLGRPKPLPVPQHPHHCVPRSQCRSPQRQHVGPTSGRLRGPPKACD
jgi:hypothetical protein